MVNSMLLPLLPPCVPKWGRKLGWAAGGSLLLETPAWGPSFHELQDSPAHQGSPGPSLGLLTRVLPTLSLPVLS